MRRGARSSAWPAAAAGAAPGGLGSPGVRRRPACQRDEDRGAKCGSPQSRSGATVGGCAGCPVPARIGATGDDGRQCWPAALGSPPPPAGRWRGHQSATWARPRAPRRPPCSSDAAGGPRSPLRSAAGAGSTGATSPQEMYSGGRGPRIRGRRVSGAATCSGSSGPTTRTWAWLAGLFRRGRRLGGRMLGYQPAHGLQGPMVGRHRASISQPEPRHCCDAAHGNEDDRHEHRRALILSERTHERCVLARRASGTFSQVLPGFYVETPLVCCSAARSAA